MKLLTDAETLECLKVAINDPKSLSVNLQVIRQHLEKTKPFGGVEELKYRFIVQSIAKQFHHSNFQQARDMFQGFIKKYCSDCERYLNDLKKTLMDDTVKLRLQQTLLKERIGLSVEQTAIIRKL
jgi:hypothetical protein